MPLIERTFRQASEAAAKEMHRRLEDDDDIVRLGESQACVSRLRPSSQKVRPGWEWVQDGPKPAPVEPSRHLNVIIGTWHWEPILTVRDGSPHMSEDEMLHEVRIAKPIDGNRAKTVRKKGPQGEGEYSMSPSAQELTSAPFQQLRVPLLRVWLTSRVMAMQRSLATCVVGMAATSLSPLE